MSLLMIHKAYMPVYSDPDFSCGTDGRTDGTGRDGPIEGSTRGPRGSKNWLANSLSQKYEISIIYSRYFTACGLIILDI